MNWADLSSQQEAKEAATPKRSHTKKVKSSRVKPSSAAGTMITPTKAKAGKKTYQKAGEGVMSLVGKTAKSAVFKAGPQWDGEIIKSCPPNSDDSDDDGESNDDDPSSDDSGSGSSASSDDEPIVGGKPDSKRRGGSNTDMAGLV